MSEPVRPRHRIVVKALASLDAAFLGRAHCYFGGGTRIVLELGEYRESAYIDFLCASREGYRALRGAVSDRSLGAIGRGKLKLAREVIADRYGIRTVLDIAAIARKPMAKWWPRTRSAQRPRCSSVRIGGGGA